MTDTIPPLPTTPVVVAPVVPAPVDGWDRFGRGIASTGRWITGFTEVRVGGAARTGFGALWAGLVWLVCRLHWLILLWGATAYLVDTGRVQLPLPNWVWVRPAPAPTALEANIRAAYVAETDPQKAAHAATLADVFATFKASATAAGTLKTVGDVYPALKTAANVKGLTGTVPVVSKAIADYLDTKLPTAPTTPLTDAVWATIGTECGNVAAALKKEAK